MPTLWKANRRVVSMERVIWDNEIKAFVDTETGRLIAPRLDEDGIDFFFVENRNCKKAEARFCSGEGYWAFPFTKEGIKKVIDKYKVIINKIDSMDEEEIIKLLEGGEEDEA